LATHAHVGQGQLHGGEDAVVPAARAPADLLVRHPVLAAGLRDGGVAHFAAPFCATPRASRMADSISTAVKGRPRILLTVLASMRNSARRTLLSWPRLSSGTSARSNRPSRSPRFGGNGCRCVRWMRASAGPAGRPRAK